MRDIPLRATELVKDLGMLIDKRMSFILHINRLICNVRRVMGYIFRNSREFRNIQTLKLLYNAFVWSRMEFGMLVWNPITEAHVMVLCYMCYWQIVNFRSLPIVFCPSCSTCLTD